MFRTFLVVAIAIGFPFAVPFSASSDEFSLGQLRTRDTRITISSTSSGPRFTLHSAEGELLAKLLTEVQLASEHPKVYKRIGSSIAGRSSGASTFQWAGCTACDEGPGAPFDLRF